MSATIAQAPTASCSVIYDSTCYILVGLAKVMVNNNPSKHTH